MEWSLSDTVVSEKLGLINQSCFTVVVPRSCCLENRKQPREISYLPDLIYL